MTTKILGISAFYHDSAACLVAGGEIVAAAQEERFSRDKHDAAFPRQAIDFCLAEGGLRRPEELDAVVFYDKPIVKFDRLVETYLHYVPRGFVSFKKAMPQWLKQKLKMRDVLRRELGNDDGGDGNYDGEILFTEHHIAHAASAFYPSPFDRAAILTVDGVGEWSTATIGVGTGREIRIVEELRFPHSLGLLYSAFTYFTGFKVNGGEYKLMGLAPYGEPRYVDVILDRLVDLRDDGSLALNMDYFDFGAGLTMTNDRFAELFGGPRREAEGPMTRREMDLARSIQVVTEEAVLRMARHAHETTGEANLVMAGGVALNCVANGRLLREGPFEDLWIQPAAGDAGGALGAALFVHHQLLEGERTIGSSTGRTADRQRGSLLGPAWSDEGIAQILAKEGLAAAAERFEDEGSLLESVADRLEQREVVGFFQGPMEFGPRALGGRSILADPRGEDVQSTLNLKIKFRESFRPFAPAVLEERVGEVFELDRPSPYMLLVADVRPELRRDVDDEPEGLDKLKIPRSDLPAVTHVDGSSRVQTVGANAPPRFRRLLEIFAEKTGCPVLVNTSFNVRGEPIVCTPREAIRCFRRTHMDAVVLGSWVLDKKTLDALEQAPVWDADTADEDREAEERQEKREARRSGVILALVLAAVAVVAYAFDHPERAKIAGGVSAGVLLTTFLAAPLWQIIHRLWMRLAMKIGEAISAMALVAVFYLVLTPAGILRRRFGRPRFVLAFRDGRPSLWTPKPAGIFTLKRYRKQH